jgi:DNA-binding protein H-NS
LLNKLQNHIELISIFKTEVVMNKNNPIDLDNLNVDELRAITENAQQLIAKKQHQRLYDAYMQFEKIAEDSNSTIEEILKAGEKLEKKRSIKYRNTDNHQETWTGRGRKPTWLVDALAAGRDLEDFAV